MKTDTEILIMLEDVKARLNQISNDLAKRCNSNHKVDIRHNYCAEAINIARSSIEDAIGWLK